MTRPAPSAGRDFFCNSLYTAVMAQKRQEGSRTGYILTERSFDGAAGTILELSCTDDEGFFLVRVPNRKLLFFIPREQELPAIEGMQRRPLTLKTPEGGPVEGLYFDSLSRFYRGRRRLKEAGLRLYESDVHPDERFLMEHFIFRSLTVHGRWHREEGYPVCTAQRIEAAEYVPQLTTLSFDIETGQDGSLYSISYDFMQKESREQAVFMLDREGVLPPGGTVPEAEAPLEGFPTEGELLKAFTAAVARLDPDLLLGWNVIGFDLTFLAARAGSLEQPLNLGRRGAPVKIIRKKSGLYAAETAGRVILDGPTALRIGFYSLDSYSLDAAAEAILGRGKEIKNSGDKVAEIEERFHSDKPALARYNLADSVLVTEIFRKTALIPQLLTRSLLTGLRLDRVAMSVAAFDFFLLPHFHRNGLVAPDVKDVTAAEHAAGGYVFTSEPGFYRDVLVFDFLSLYPSLIRTFHIGPLSRIRGATASEKQRLVTPAGIPFHTEEHILPFHVENLMRERGNAKKKGDSHLSQAIKILMNSYYGVMGTPGCRFYHPDLPTAITGTGQWVLKTTAEFFRSKGYRVLYGDTDSVFVESTPGLQRCPRELGQELAEEVTRYWRERLKNDFGADSCLELELEKHYRRFFLPPMRGSREGARKRYAGLRADDDSLELKGLESVRSDWTEAAKIFQRELFRRCFHDEEVGDWIRGLVEDIRRGHWDDKLVYRRKLTKPAEEYTKNVPPHVKAAKLLASSGQGDIRTVTYVITARGPVPLAHAHPDLDYQHYIDKQIRPLADMVLPFTGEAPSLEELLSGRQLDLWENG